MANEPKAIARRLGDRATFVDVVRRCPALVAPSTLVPELADVAEALSAAGDLDDPSVLVQVGMVGVALAVRVGEFELAGERLAAVHAAAERLRQPLFLWQAAYADAAFALMEGDTEEAERLATAALEVGTAGGEPDAFPFYGIQLMSTRGARGRLAELEALIAESAEQNPTIPAFRAALAAAHLDAGDDAAARELIDEAAAVSFSLPDDSAWHDAMVDYSRL